MTRWLKVSNEVFLILTGTLTPVIWFIEKYIYDDWTDQRPAEVPAKFQELAQDERLRILSKEQALSIIKRFAIIPTIE